MGKLTVVYGGQFGSEGKGQIAAHIARVDSPTMAVRVGGPNAGHTFINQIGNKQVVQSLPSAAFISSDIRNVIGAAGLVIPSILKREMEEAAAVLGKIPLLDIDRCAAVIEECHMQMESEIKETIGSTGEGVGAATAEKVMRIPGILVQDSPVILGMLKEAAFLRTRIRYTPEWLNRKLRNPETHILIEGTQGVGLSLHTSGYYPFATSRECTPQALMSQTGISPFNSHIYERIMVVRTYPIRVGGNSGPMKNEINWESLYDRTGGYVTEPEITTVTKKIRRIAEMDYGALTWASICTRPTSIALSFFDYWFPEIAGKTDLGGMTREQWAAIRQVEAATGVSVDYIGTGFGSVIDLHR